MRPRCLKASQLSESLSASLRASCQASTIPTMYCMKKQIGPGCSRKTPLEDPQGRDLLLELDIGATQLPVEIGKLW